MKTLQTVFWLLAATPAWAYAPFGAPVALVAGEGSAGYTDGEFDQARFDGINSLLLDEAANRLYVADGKNGAIRCVDLGQRNEVTTVAGRASGGVGFPGAGPAPVGEPAQMTWGADTRAIYFTDRACHRVMKLDLASRALQVLSGGPAAGFADGEGAQARFSRPEGLAYLAVRNLLVVADADNGALRVVDPGSGRTSTLVRDPALVGLRFVISEHPVGKLLFTLANRPGLWSLRMGASGYFTVDRLSFPRDQAGWQGNTLTPEIYQPVENELTAWALNRNCLYYALRLSAFNRDRSPLRMFSVEQPQIKQDLDYHLWLPLEEEAEWAALKTGSPAPYQKYRLFDYASGLAIADGSRTVYLADAANQRVLALKLPDPNLETYASRPAPGVKRVVLMGNSLNYVVVDHPRVASRFAMSQASLCKRLEYWLNLFAFLRGGGERYEVIFSGFNNNFYHSVLARAMEHQADLVERYQADVVLVNFTYEDLVDEAFGYLFRPVEHGDLSIHQDPEFLMRPLAERTLHPDGRRLYAYLLEHPERVAKFAWLTKGKLETYVAGIPALLDQEDNRSLVFELATTQLERYRDLLRQRDRSTGRDTRLVINLLPRDYNLSNTEVLNGSVARNEPIRYNFLSQALRGWCEQKGVGFQDALGALKVLEPSLFPLFNVLNDHYTKKAVDVIACVTAYQLLQAGTKR